MYHDQSVRAVLEDVWRCHYSKIKNYSFKICRGKNIDAEALVAEAFIKALRYGLENKNARISHQLIMLILKQLFFNEVKKSNFRQESSDFESQIGSTPSQLLPVDEKLIINEQLNAIGQICNKSEYEILLRKFFHGESHADIATSLNISETACRQRIRYARKKIAAACL